MGAQSIKIPIQLEVQQLQGSINYIKKALDKLDPGTNLYKSLEKGLNKVIQQMNALEVESKQSFGSVKEIENFEKNFNKVGTSVQELGNLLNKVSFSDLGKIFSKDDLQPIEDAKNEIDKLQKNISKIKTDKMFELTRSSKDFGDIITKLGANTFDKAVSGIEQQVKNLTKSIDSAEASLSGLQNTLLTNKNLSEQYNKVSSFDEIKKNFLNSYQKDGKQLLRFKAGGREQLTNILQGMGFDDATLEQVKKVSIDKLEELFQSLEKEIKKKVDIQNKSLQKAQDNYKKAFAEQETRINLRADYNTALDQLRDIEIDPTLQSTIDSLNDKIEEQEQKIIDLQKQLLITSGIQQDGIKAQQQATDTIEEGTKAIRAQADAAQEQAKAQELLSNIKFAIKNWFGFNEVINLTKNAVRNMITQIRELDDVMTQIAIVTDMTQQELWDQMDTYSAMAQQYGASIKGVYEVSQLYYQQGLQTAEVMNLTEETLKMAKIANLDYAEATDYMTVALRGFKLEMSDAQQVTDVYSALAAATASDTEELAVAMSKTASSAEAVGSSFESTSAMIATMISITREAPENIGSALKSIISRYGEMTSDPMKLVDSEGEEMNLNKVDKALQSVGISLQDAQGQFRDFDDVILELSKSWDTIDTNTQRYIATIMAGNRQQSRFLALVGNYEEYAKALEVAENAEDAGTLQTLKTMDSISTKWEQLKVSLQEFYTSAGLEDVFKGVLDALTAFLTKANDIPKLFGKIPVSVFALVSSLITSIKSVATSLTSAIIGPISDFSKKLDEVKNKSPLEIKVVAKADVSSADTAVNQLNNAVQQRSPIITGQTTSLDINKRQALQNYFNDLDNNQNQNLIELEKYSGIKDANKLLEYSKQLKNLTKEQREALLSGKSLDEVLSKIPKTLTNAASSTSKFSAVTSKVKGVFGKYSNVIGMATSALSAYLLTLKDSSSASAEWSKVSSGAINVVSGIGRIWGGDYVGGAMQFISGLPALIDGIVYSTEEKLKNATEEATKLNNITLQKKSDYKNLKNETEELENLTEARHNNAEAYQEWLDYNNQMASSYPELISYIDSEGNAIIDLAASYNSLELARLAAAKAAKESIVADLNQAGLDKQNSEEKLSNFYKNIDVSLESAFNQLASFKIEATETSLGTITEQNANAFLSNYFQEIGITIDEETKEQIDETSKFLSNNVDFKEFLANPTSGVLSQSIFNTLVSDFELGEIISLSSLQEYAKIFTESTVQPHENYSFLTDEVNEIISVYEDVKAGTVSPENLIPFISDVEGMKKIAKLVTDTRSKSTSDNDIYDQAADALEELVTLHGSYQALVAEQALKDKQLAATNRKAISTFAYYDNETSSAEIGEELTNFNELVTDFMVRRWKQSNKDIYDYLQSQESLDYQEFESAFEEIWRSLSSSQQTALNELLVSREDYDFGDYKEALADFGITQGVIYDELTTQWYEEYGQAYGNFINAIESRNEKDNYIEKGISNLYSIAPKYYDEILDFYDKVNLQISDGLISQLQGSDILNAYSSLWQQSKGLENKAEIQKILAEGDFTSLDGIYSLKESLKKAGFDANTILENLANSINVNVLTEWETFGQKVKTGLESFTEALTNATEGMDYEDAINMASKLEMSLSDFRFEDGEYFLDDIETIQKVYSNFGEELKNKLIEQTDKELNTLSMQRESAYKMGDYKTAADLSSQMAEIQTAQENVESSVNEYIAYHTNLAYLTAGLYDGFIQQIGGSGSVAEMLAAGRESDTKLREYLLALGSENITEETVDGYVAAITDRISSVNDSILSLILDKNVGKGGSADISHLVEKTDLEGFTKITAEKIPELFAKMFGENYEAYNDAMLQYMEDSSADVSGMIADLAGDIEHIDYSSVFEIANALGKNVNKIIGLFTDNLDGTFSTSLNNIQTLAQIAGIGITSEIQDAIREYLDNILGIVSNGISGSMTNVEFETLSNFMGLDLDFTETSEGLKLTKASAIEVYTELKKIDSIQAQITFSDLAESLEEAGSGYEDVASTMKTIAELNRELADVPVSSERRAELERELAVAEEILRVRSQDPDSFNFMDKDLPTGMQGPENYWNSVGEAYKVMNESAKSGYMEIQDYVNIVNQMEAMAIAAGQEFSIGGMNAAQLIEKGMSSLKNIDGEGVKIAMEGVGIDFANAATDMGLSFDDGIKEVAKSQIKMLDAAIRMLEAMVAMENIDANGDGFLGLGEIFKEGANLKDGIQESDWDEDVIEWADNLQDAAGKISIGGKSLLDALATLRPEQVQNVLNQLMSIDWTLGDTDIASQIQNVLSAYFPDVDITQGKSVFDILEVPDDADKNAEHFTKWLDKFDLNIKEYNQIKKALDLNSQISTENNIFKNIEKMLGLKEGDNRFENLYSNLKDLGYGIQDAVKIWDEITITDEDGKTTYTYNGTDYTDLNSALAARRMSDKSGEKISDVTAESEGGVITAKGTVQAGETTIEVLELKTGSLVYLDSQGQGHSTLREAIDSNVKSQVSQEGVSEIEAYAQYGIDITADKLSKVSVSGIKDVLSSDAIGKAIADAQGGAFSITIDGQAIEFEAGTTEEQVRQKLMEAIGIDAAQMETIVTAISTAISTADWSKVGEAITTALTGENGELKIQPTSVSIDGGALSSATLADGTSIPEGGIPLTEKVKVTATADPLEITSVTNPTLNLGEEGTIDVGEIGKVEGTASSGLEITIPEGLNADSISLINQFNSAISAAAANATVNSGITVTITGLDEAGISNIEDYSGAAEGVPEGEITSSVIGDISIDVFDLFKITQLKSAVEALKADPNVNSTISAQAEGNALDVVSDIMALYGYDGQTAQLAFSALDPEGTLAAVYDQVSQITASDDANLIYTAELIKDEIEKQLAELTKDRTINITPTLVNPGDMEDPAYYIGDGTGKAYNTTTYSTLQGAQDRLNQLKVEKGDLAGNFTVELIDLATSQIDATTLTITPLDSINLSATNVTLTANRDNGNNNNNKGSDSGQGAGGGGELPILDVSAITSAIQEIGEVSNTAATNVNTAIQKFSEIDTSSIDTARTKIGTLSSAIRGIPTSGAGRINSVATAIRNLPSSKTISINYSLKVSASVSGSGVTGATGFISGGSGYDRISKNSVSGTLAKGNIALAKGTGPAMASGRRTLVGELGPELVVSHGRYYLVGQNGAEFVNLADDAIVFNHLQTKKLMGSSGKAGRGFPVTSERNAVSLATGNVSGPAMASASEALAQLRQIRAMWQAMLDASAQDLGSKAGSGGGGGGGGGGGEDVKAVTGELERWYNLLRQIDSLEQHITLEQAKRANMLSGYNYVDSLEKELEMLKEQQKAYKLLSDLQKDYYDRRREDLLSTDYSKIFTYTEHGLMQYVDGENRGLDVLAKLNERDATGKLINNAVDAKAQIKYLQSIGFDTSILKNNEDGTQAENEEGMMENFWAGVDGWMEELDGLYDSYHEAITNFEESTEKMNEILQEYIDNQLSVEQKLLQAIQDREQAEIDRIQDEKDALEEAAQSYIDGLNDALSKEQDMYSKNETNAETQKLQRQLAILQRSGGSTSEIKSLQDQIDSRLKDAYFQEQQDQIDAIQEASDNQLEKLQTQIDLMTETLEYQKEHGLLWNEVYEMMNQWTPEQMLQFIEQYTKSYQENSKLQNDEDSKETLKELQLYTAKRDQDAIDAAANERNAAWLEYYKSLTQYSEEFKTKHQEAAKKAFDDAYGTGDLAAGKSAADKVFADAKKAEEAAAQAPVEKEEETFKGFKAKNNTGAHTLYEKNNRSGKRIDSVANGEEVTILGKGTKGIVYVENKSGKKGFMKLASLKVLDSGFNFNNLPQYEKGGTIDFTGLAMVHGSKNKPESILSAEHTKLLKNGIFSDSNHSLAATVEAIQELAKNIVSSGGTTETGINIEHLSVEIQPGVISSDYDARRAGEMALEEMVRIARKTTNRVVSR